MKRIVLLLIICIPFLVRAEEGEKVGQATVSGYVKDENGEDLIGANVYISSTNQGTVSNVYGFYSITLPKGEYELVYSFIGYNAITKKVKLSEDKTYDILLLPANEEIEEVMVTSERKDKNVQQIKMSNIKLQTKTIKKIPLLMGEADVIKSIQLLPGVQTSVEGSSGFYVRGGNADQNLILLDEATVYNPSHLFGFFSVFNGDAIKNVELYKGGIPSEYGGRLSSVLDVRMNEGNTEKVKVEGGIGTISSRFTIDGPLVKNKSSFIISGRRTYADLFLPFAKDTMAQNSNIYFYDLNAKFNYKINKDNRLFVSGYFGRDINGFGNMFEMNYGNATGTVRWNHVYNGRIFSNVTLIYSNFDYNLGQPEGSLGFKWKSNMIDYSIKNDYTYFVNPSNTLKFGIQSTYHTLKPGVSEQRGDDSFVREMEYPEAYAIESAVFASNTHNITSRLMVQYGIRFSLFQNIGEGTIYTYENYEPVATNTYDKGEIYNTYSGFEPRISARYTVDNNSSVKVSYNRLLQYMHLASNSTATFPLDMWFLSNQNVEPQKVDQVAGGYFRNFFDNKLEASAEVYYKKMYNTIDFKDHAFLVPNQYLEGELRIGEANSYGLELMVKKSDGKLNGWVSYTYSKTLRDIPEINFGKKYAPPYDKPHNINVVATYDASKKWTVSANWVYSSAKPVTVPVKGYYYGNVYVPEYSERNSVRIPGTDYHRLDFSATRNMSLFKKYEGSLVLSVYNVYNRHNAFAVYFRQKGTGVMDEPGTVTSEKEVVKLYLFPIVPSLTFNVKF